MKKLFLVGLLAVAAANATITPFLVYPQGGAEVTAPPACTAVGTDCRYDYSVLIEAGYQVMEGDFFTIYDFNDIVELAPGTFAVGTDAPATDWTASVNLIGPTAPVAPGRTDDPKVHNITYTYTGSGINTGPIQGGGSMILSGFWAVSSSNELAVTHFSAGDNRLNPPGASANGSTVFGPASGGNDTVVPEPMSMALLGGGLSVLGLLRFRKRS
jgi:hypothetical protein